MAIIKAFTTQYKVHIHILVIIIMYINRSLSHSNSTGPTPQDILLEMGDYKVSGQLNLIDKMI